MVVDDDTRIRKLVKDFLEKDHFYVLEASNGEEAIYITVMNIPPGVNGQDVASSQGGVQKNLLGTTGYYTEDSDGYYTFAFVSGAYLDIVTVSSPYVLDQITYSG